MSGAMYKLDSSLQMETESDISSLLMGVTLLRGINIRKRVPPSRRLMSGPSSERVPSSKRVGQHSWSQKRLYSDCGLHHLQHEVGVRAQAGERRGRFGA